MVAWRFDAALEDARDAGLGVNVSLNCCRVKELKNVNPVVIRDQSGIRTRSTRNCHELR
jgi:hypothetical protein